MSKSIGITEVFEHTMDRQRNIVVSNISGYGCIPEGDREYSFFGARSWIISAGEAFYSSESEEVICGLIEAANLQLGLDEENDGCGSSGRLKELEASIQLEIEGARIRVESSIAGEIRRLRADLIQRLSKKITAAANFGITDENVKGISSQLDKGFRKTQRCIQAKRSGTAEAIINAKLDRLETLKEEIKASAGKRIREAEERNRRLDEMEAKREAASKGINLSTIRAAQKCLSDLVEPEYAFDEFRKIFEDAGHAIVVDDVRPNLVGQGADETQKERVLRLSTRLVSYIDDDENHVGWIKHTEEFEELRGAVQKMDAMAGRK